MVAARTPSTCLYLATGTLYLCEPTIDAREAECARVQAATGAAFVHPYNDPKVMAGACSPAKHSCNCKVELDPNQMQYVTALRIASHQVRVR